ncbi:hypothetical protein Ae201684P_012638 [Aphanomyces euteiches]|uniref:DDE-1 domain-containing protein n=1 Tax=Aphanomyces euteiches TaxID=100861 RepID=A0A6G0WB80_9STRA|nr:hypothetical protein Ae201684_016818 [Aphanomyces euteiches]KAH9076150.1 hypothetical protein Ae201684P_012638 [Aphanomyces euteiches]KAH9152145.1 hypothetical protein AeRB84_005382 [Aphanomyces euteiches]
MDFIGSKTRRRNTGNGGAKPIIPDPHELAIFVRDLHREELPVTSGHMIKFLRMNHKEWLEEYMSSRKSRYQSLLRLLQRFADRYDFSRRRLCKHKHTQADLGETRVAFGHQFHDQYGHMDLDCIYNADENGIYYDTCSTTIWPVRGGGSYVAKGERHLYRMTAVSTIRADGLKLPILFIIRGANGGVIENSEFETYPCGHVYAMQGSAWMDASVWRQYLREVLYYKIENPSVLLVDNFESHVCIESEKIIRHELGSELCALPPNSTTYCQTLDVSIMGPFNQHMRDLWVLSDDNATTAIEKRMVMIQRAIQAWEMISEDEVRASFVKALPK